MDTLGITRRAAGVAQVTMARPAVFNAFDEAMIAEIDAAFAQFVDDPEVRVIVLAGEGRQTDAPVRRHNGHQRTTNDPVGDAKSMIFLGFALTMRSHLDRR